MFSPNSSGDLRSGARQSQIIGGDADVDHTQSIGGDTVKLLGDISPRVSAPLNTPLLNQYLVSWFGHIFESNNVFTM